MYAELVFVFLGQLFEQTQQLFWSWVRYVISVIFSIAVLAFMSGIVMKISIGYAMAVAAALVMQQTGLGTAFGIDWPNIMKTCMMQGGLGMVLSLMLITIPPMVMQFFSVSLGGGVSGYSPFSGTAPSGGGVAESKAGGVATTTNSAGTNAPNQSGGWGSQSQSNHNWEDFSTGDRGAYKATSGELIRDQSGTAIISSGNLGVDRQRMSEAKETDRVMAVRNQLASAQRQQRGA